MIYRIEKEFHNKKDLERIFAEHPEIKFVSLVALDIFAQVLVPGIVFFWRRVLCFGNVVREQRTEGVIDLFVIAVPHTAVERTVFLCVVAMA